MVTIRKSRRRPALAALVAAGGLAAALIAAPLVVADGANPDVAAGEAELTEPYALSRHQHDPRAQARADAARRARCADPERRAPRPRSCPADESGRLGAQEMQGGFSAFAAEGLSTQGLSENGAWSAPFDMPLVGETHVVLPTGKVLLIGPAAPRSANTSRAFVYDPEDGALRRVDPPVDPATGHPYNVWCAGQTLLPNGAVMVAGGNLAYADGQAQWKGLDRIFTFDPWTETWTEQPRMAKGRWYPTLVPMADGRVVIYGGWDHTGTNAYQRDIEIFTPSADPGGRGTLELRPSSRNPGLYSQMTVLPGGDILHAGPREGDAAILDTDSWSWRTLSRLDRRYWGSHVVMHEGPGKPHRMLRVGGTDASSTAVEPAIGVIDLSAPTPSQSLGPALVTPRAHLNTVILPDGALLAVGGGRGQDGTGSLYADPVYTSELLEPGAAAWRVVGRQAEERAYHSAASLLPDGRVLSSGDDRAGIAASNADRAEIYSPPYLFRGARPQVTSAPSSVGYGAGFSVASPQAAAVRRAVLIAPAAVTHSTDMTQRSVALSFSAGPGKLSLSAPADASIAPPGYYQLFLVDDAGVPSEARWLRLGDSGATAPDDAAPPPPPSAGRAASASLPRGFVVEKRVRAQITGDRTPDRALVLVRRAPAGTRGEPRPRARRLMILEGRRGGGPVPIGQGRRILLCTRCGGALFGVARTPVRVRVRARVVIVEQESGSRVITRQRFRIRSDAAIGTRLIGVQVRRSDRLTGRVVEISTNLVTGKRRVTRTDPRGRRRVTGSTVPVKRLPLEGVDQRLYR